MISLLSARPNSTIATFTLSHSIKDPVMMHSSGENRRKRKNDSDKRGAYRKFDEASSRMRDSLLHNCAERVVAHAASNNGSCRRGFVKDMVREIHERAPLMGISRDDINNKVRIMKSKLEEEERRVVPPPSLPRRG